jgi:hypothetical protein
MMFHDVHAWPWSMINGCYNDEHLFIARFFLQLGAIKTK